MKKYLIAALFTVVIAGCYYFSDVRAFSTNVARETRHHLFSVFNRSKQAHIDLIILNIGQLSSDEIQARLDTVLKYNPRMVGVNMCDFDWSNEFRAHFAKNPKVVLSYCDNPAFKTRFSRIVDEGNVTHFRTSPDYFEMKLTNSYEKLRARGNEEERINFRPWQSFFIGDLKDVELGHLENSIVLVGNPGDYWSSEDEIYEYEGRRITPMNSHFGLPSIPPDMDDMIISANIIATIETDDFFTEVPTVARIGVIFGLCVFSVLFISLIRTPWLLVNLAIYVMFYYLIVFGASWIIVYLFVENYYLNLDELQLLLIITSTFTIVSSYQTRREKAASKTMPA